ncbi:MAG: hypothetical protein IT182_02370 [Acidobacteria bacterium]|nr:hypothetical protein [Acidobacteriota bacterium]
MAVSNAQRALVVVRPDKQVLAAPDNPAMRKMQDAATKAFSPAFSASDSTKVVRGSTTLRTTT